MTDHARIDEADAIITVTLTRPDKLNAISPAITETLWTATRQLAERDDLRCMLITAEGRFFTAGIDLSAASEGREDVAVSDRPGWNERRRYRQHHLLYDEMENLEKPIVLAAQGTCLGAGLEMATSCDFRFCTPNAQWALPEIQLGVIAGSGGSSRLTKLVGPAWAKYLAMAGMKISADQALRMGLVHDVFPEETFAEQVRAFCRHLAGLPPEALGLAKLALNIAADVQDRTVQRHVDRVVNTMLIHSEEHRRATARFAKPKKGA